MNQDKHLQAAGRFIWGRQPMPEMSPTEMAPPNARVIDIMASELETSKCHCATALAFNNFWRDAYQALFDHGLDIRRLPSYDAKPCHRGSATLRSAKRWADRMRREIRAEVHRCEVGVAVLVASAPAPDPKAARLAAAKRRGRKRPPHAPLRLVWSNRSPSPPPDEDEWE